MTNQYTSDLEAHRAYIVKLTVIVLMFVSLTALVAIFLLTHYSTQTKLRMAEQGYILGPVMGSSWWGWQRACPDTDPTVGTIGPVPRKR